MNTIHKFSGVSLVIMVSLILFFSCKEENNPPDDINYLSLAEDAAVSENVFKDLFKVVDNESKNGQYQNVVGKRTLMTNSVVETCAIVTLNTNGGNWPMTLTIDFGAGCTDAYGVNRKGKIIAVYSGPYRNAGSTVEITTDNYYVNDYKVDGTETITNDGRNASNHLEFSVSVADGVITKPNGGVITWESERTNEWIAGESTTFLSGLAGICDDVYLVTGYGQGTTSAGYNYRIDITAPLKKQICCYWVIEGTIDLKINGNLIASIDYGDGTCNPNANLTYGNNTIVIVIS